MIDHSKRLEKLRKHWINRSKAFLLIKPEFVLNNNLRYITNFSGSTGVFLQTESENFLFVDARYWERAEMEVFKEIKVIRKNFINIKEILKEFKIKSLMVDNSLTYLQYVQIKKLKINLKTSDAIFQLRKVKDKNEIKILKKAQKITDKIFVNLLDFIKAGSTEKEIAVKINELANYYGADSLSFDPVVASGRNSSIPHYKTSKHKIEKDNVLLIDFGVKYKGYVSDMTRTIWVGNNVSNEFKKAYNTVLNAQNLAIGECKFKNKKFANEIHKKVVSFINKTQFKNKFLHGTGHGIGLDIHELPYLNIKSKDVLIGNEVVTIEPGIYLEGKFGIRIEDVVITKSGKDITKSTKEMIIL